MLGNGEISLLVDLVSREMQVLLDEGNSGEARFRRLAALYNKLLLVRRHSGLLPEPEDRPYRYRRRKAAEASEVVVVEEQAQGTRLCPRCAFEGMRNDLSRPYLTEEGWVQECPVHGRLYLWGHYIVRPDGHVTEVREESLTGGPSESPEASGDDGSSR